MPPDERLGHIAIEDEMKSSYLDYAMSVIVGRALPDVRDGLNRSIAESVRHERNGPASTAYRKFKIVGEIMGNYHPTVTRHLRYPRADGAEFQHALSLVDGQATMDRWTAIQRLRCVTPKRA